MKHWRTALRQPSLHPNDYRPHVMTSLVYSGQMKLKPASEALDKAIPLAPRVRLKEIYLLKSDVDGRRGATDEASLLHAKL